MYIIFKNLTCADWPKWPKTSPEWYKNEKNWNCFGNLYQTSYLNSWILIFAPADCTKLKTKDKLGQIQKTSWHFSGYIVQLGCPKLSFTNGLINKAKGWRVDVYSSDTRYKDVKRWKKNEEKPLKIVFINFHVTTRCDQKWPLENVCFLSQARHSCYD